MTIEQAKQLKPGNTVWAAFTRFRVLPLVAKSVVYGVGERAATLMVEKTYNTASFDELHHTESDANAAVVAICEQRITKLRQTIAKHGGANHE